jgi:hypothetical protein
MDEYYLRELCNIKYIYYNDYIWRMEIKTIYNYVFSLVISKIIIYFECPI